MTTKESLSLDLVLVARKPGNTDKHEPHLQAKDEPLEASGKALLD